MKELSRRMFGVVLALLLATQFLFGLWHIDYPFVDGRHHYNWGPAFWLLHAESINEVGLANTYFGLKDYASHPQLMGPVIATWTNAFGYSEASIRLLALSLTVLATLFLALAARTFVGGRRALLFTLFFASIPLIYVYGKKLDQEALVLVFLALHLWGIGLFEKKNRKGLALIGVGSLGMMLSDWSGALFALATVAYMFFAWGWRARKGDIILATFVSWSASGVGLVLFLVQSYLQSGAKSLSDLIHNYYTLWQYRTGITIEGFSFMDWARKQVAYARINFTVLVLVASVSGFIATLWKKFSPPEEGRNHFAFLTLWVGLGALLYMAVVPYASAVHLYYQYYFAIPVAVGLMFAVEFVVSRTQALHRSAVFILATAGVFALLATFSIIHYQKMLFENSWGNKTDVLLLKSLRDIPEDESIITLNDNHIALDWFRNPNITYYTGRPEITTYLFTDGAPLSEYILLPIGLVDQFMAFINSGQGYGAGYGAKKERCSDHLCLLRIGEVVAR